MMIENDDKRMLLKVKRRKNQVAQKNVSSDVNKGHEICRERGKKRANPFIFSGPSKKSEILDTDEKFKDNAFLAHLDSKDETIFVARKTVLNIVSLPEKDVEIEKTSIPETVEKSEFNSFPLDWSIKNQVRFLSCKPFAAFTNVKPKDQCAGIISFTQCENENNDKLHKFLTSWIYPNIPGLPYYPLKKSMSGTLKGACELNVLSNNSLFQALVLKSWQNSFQSLYNMLRTGYCPFFYVCSYQYTVLFTAIGVSSNKPSAIITPTTKGFRTMLEQEGISFEFTIPEGDNYNELLVCKDLDENLNKSLDTEDTGNTEFLDSIGLTAREHFPKIQEQQRLNDRAKMRLLDNRMESTVRTTDCNSLFNFLLNSNFLCAPSGTMAGIPPTLISPSPFEGGSLSLCRAACGPLQHQHGTKTQALFCLDVSGIILPTQLKGLVSLLVNQSEQSGIIQLKSSNRLSGLNSYKQTEKCDIPVEHIKMLGLSTSLLTHINQEPVYLPNFCEIKYEGNIFKY